MTEKKEPGKDKSNRVVTPLNIDKDFKRMMKVAGVNMSETANQAFKATLEVKAAEGDLKEMEEYHRTMLLAIRAERVRRGDILIGAYAGKQGHEAKVKDREEELTNFARLLKRKHGKLERQVWIFWADHLGFDSVDDLKTFFKII